MTKRHRLGLALRMCTVRYAGLFLEAPLAVPWPVIEHLAVQLGIEDPSVVKRYTERRQTLYDHAWEIRDADGYHPYEDAEWGRRFRTFPHGRAWTHAEGPKALFDHAVGWLRRHRVMLPGVSVLDLFQVLMAARLLNTAKRKTEKERLSTLPQSGKVSRVLARPAKVLFEELELVEEQETDLDATALRAAGEEVAPRATVMTAAVTVVTLVPGDENSAEVAMRAALANRYATVRPFLALRGGPEALDAASAGKHVLAGVRGRSPGTGGSPRPSACCGWSTRWTTPTVGSRRRPAPPRGPREPGR